MSNSKKITWRTEFYEQYEKNVLKLKQQIFLFYDMKCYFSKMLLWNMNKSILVNKTACKKSLSVKYFMNKSCLFWEILLILPPLDPTKKGAVIKFLEKTLISLQNFVELYCSCPLYSMSDSKQSIYTYNNVNENKQTKRNSNWSPKHFSTFFETFENEISVITRN